MWRKVTSLAGLGTLGAAATVIHSNYNRKDNLSGFFQSNLFNNVQVFARERNFSKCVSQSNFAQDPESILDPHKMKFAKSFWDDNWDRKELIYTGDGEAPNVEDEVVKINNPTATRHIILIRHGQYNLDGETDEERKLTDLGREQVALID